MDAVSDPSIKQVVVMAGAQLGKSEALLNVIGYHIEHDPCPTLMMQPTVEMAQSFSKDRITSGLLNTTPSLRGKVKDPRARDSGNTTLHKTYPAGSLSLVGANSPAGMASRPIRLVLFDEVDRYPVSAGEEGDPIALATKRTLTFWNRKIVMVSTPTDKGSSRIEDAYEETDKRKYYVPCPHCDHEQVLEWKNIQWEGSDPKTAAYYCGECGVAWSDTDRHKAVSKGKWIATEEFDGIAGFHISALYSPWVSIIDWPDDLPEGVVVLTAGVDVQDDRVAFEILGTGSGHETWSIQYDEIYGDPSSAELWQRLDEVLNQTFIHPIRGEMIIRSTCVDSGGHYTQQVYNYARQRAGKRVFAIKGIGGEGKPIAGKPSRNNIGKINLFPVGTDTAKELIFARLKITEEGAGYCHFPFTHNEEYFRMLTSEKKVTKYYKGRPKREWVKIRQRNEALDCRVYAMAALELMGLNIEHLAKQGKNKVKSSQAVPKRRTFKPRPNNFVTGY